MMAPVSVCHHVSTTGQRSPPIVLVVPDPRFGIDGFADGSDEPQRRQVVPGGVLVAPLHERPDRSRRGVEDRHLVLLDDRPEAVLVGEVGRAFVHHARRAVRERPVDDVGVAGDPADVGGAPVDVGVGVQVEDVLVGVGDLGEVAARGVHDALGLPGGARRVEDVEQVFAVHRFGRALGGLAGHDARATRGRGRPAITTSFSVRRRTRTCSIDGVCAIASSAMSLSAHDRTAAPRAVGRDEHLGFGVVDAVAQRRRGEAAEHDRVRRADARAREQRDGELGHHAHVDRDPIALADAERLEQVGDPARLVEELRVGDGARVAGLALPVECDLIAVAGVRRDGRGSCTRR